MGSTIDQILLMQDTIIVTLYVAGTQGLTISSEIVSREIDPVLFILLLNGTISVKRIPSNGRMVNCHVSYAINN